MTLLGRWFTDGIPLGAWVEGGVEVLEDVFSNSFDVFSDVTLDVYDMMNDGLMSAPPWIVVLAFALLAWVATNWKVATFTLVGLFLTVNIGMWPSFVSTLTLVVLAEVLVVAFGLPLGVLAAVSDVAEGILKPILDFMQTMPAFVYLIPAVSFFGLGVVPGIVSTVIFAIPPLIRLTNLGLRQVPHELIEAAEAFGATRGQRLVKIQFPVAVPTVMAGVNQSIMLNLSMVVIAALIGAEGLGRDVIRGMNILDIGLGFEAGLAIVIMAIVLDRITQAMGRRGPD
ncbi:MAG: ABC transporter permease [Jiangellaceae bacterium]